LHGGLARGICAIHALSSIGARIARIKSELANMAGMGQNEFIFRSSSNLTDKFKRKNRSKLHEVEMRFSDAADVEESFLWLPGTIEKKSLLNPTVRKRKGGETLCPVPPIGH